ncbi:hypothetical protein [Thermococcus sp.]|uniref:hypothetical protein n=1 Tax=Thermococcus sp. TaxID=35749 RepID=UPI00262DC798|nr:hypothetical protein [Thermococcus sp.]
MIGVTAGSAAAIPTTESPIKNPVQPMIFGDKSELHLSFEPYLSYVYKGRIYLAYHWEWDHTEKLIDGPNDYIVITIPWQVYVDNNGHIKSGIDSIEEIEQDIKNHNGHWEDIFYMEQPVVEVSPSSGWSLDSMGLITWSPKKIDGYWFRFMKITIKVDDDISSGYIYVGVRPKPEYQGLQVTTAMYYIHTYSRASALNALGSVGVSIVFPENIALLGTTGTKILSGIVSWAIGDIISGHSSVKGWEKSTTGDAVLSYDAYFERTDPPSGPGCFKGICPTSYSNSNNK